MNNWTHDLPDSVLHDLRVVLIYARIAGNHFADNAEDALSFNTIETAVAEETRQRNHNEDLARWEGEGGAITDG